jgi:hypothetical protein
MALDSEQSKAKDLEAELTELRNLRARADKLLKDIAGDLKPFKHDDQFTFLRTPDSRPAIGDVNVTTTCSCVMALVLTQQFKSFYKKNAPRAAGQILSRLIDAPWMSSGLILNNSFTTILVLRTFGFLKDGNLLLKDVPALKKKWDLNFKVKDPIGLAKKLRTKDNGGIVFLYRSLSDSTRHLFEESQVSEEKLGKALTSDLRRIIQSGWIYETARFGRQEDLSEVLKDINGYKTTEFNYRLLSGLLPDHVHPLPERTFAEIAKEIASHPEQNFAIND